MKTSLKIFIIVLLFSAFIVIGLIAGAWDINFWPTDIRDYYLDATWELPNLKYVSQIHESLDATRVRFLHGKEGMILLAAFFQKLLKDYGSLRPFLLITILSFGLSSILIFLIARKYWGKIVGLICFGVFVTSFWPYIYILFIKHQPLGLVFFLLALFFLQKSHVKGLGWVYTMLSGACLCFGFYSSTISALYLPYYFAGFLHEHNFSQWKKKEIPHQVWYCAKTIGLCALGFAPIFIYFNYPNILYNIKAYFEYVSISSSFNHFYYQQPYLRQWISEDIPSTRGGWLWIIKYFIVIMPVLFPVFILCGAYLFYRCFRARDSKEILIILGLILLSLSSPLLAEIRGVAQYGANYFSSFIGIIMLLGYTLYVVGKNGVLMKIKPFSRQLILITGSLVFCVHACVNGYLFFDDIFPSRLATTFLSRKIDSLGIKQIYTYGNHPNRRFMIDYLKPELYERLKFIPLDNIYQAQEGYILVPPVTTESVYNGQTAYTDFSKDIYWNELMKKGNIEDYAVASFRTLASSRIWPLEEEVLTYKRLILDVPFPDRLNRGKVWILDAKKLQRDMKKNFPRKEYFQLILTGARNIGTRERVYMYNGITMRKKAAAEIKTQVMRMYKIGNPDDQLVTYIYKRDPKDKALWLPYGEHFASLPVKGKDVTSDVKGKLVLFSFAKTIKLIPGTYLFIIFRTGPANDENFYRAYMESKKYNDDYKKAATIPGVDLFNTIRNYKNSL